MCLLNGDPVFFRVMATAGKVEAVEVYTVNEPCGAKTLEYKVLMEIKSCHGHVMFVVQGLVMCSKVKTRNLLSDFKSAFKSIKGGELTELTKLTQDVRYLIPIIMSLTLSTVFISEMSCCMR